MFKLTIDKESTPAALEEKIRIHLDPNEVSRYVDLLKKTWLNMKMKTENYRKYA